MSICRTLTGAAFVAAVFVAMPLMASAPPGPTVIYVDADNCPGPGSGTEGDPYCSIQDGIDAAVDGDEVVVAPGTYFEAIDFLGKAITLRSSEGPETTTIDATGLESSVVKCVNGEGLNTVLEGFTITGGTGTPAEVSTPILSLAGGGMFNDGSGPMVTDCTFEANTATYGAGMCNLGASPALIDCEFAGNSGVGGGGLANISSTLAVKGCAFDGNAAFVGAGLFNNESSLIVSDCTFSGNVADHGGGGVINAYTSLVVANSSFMLNDAGPDLHGAGAIWDFGGVTTVINSVFIMNFGWEAGAIASRSATVTTVAGCTLTQNVGGGMRGGSVINSIIWDNVGDQLVDTSVSFSDVQGGWPGIGNIDADPLFVDPANGDFRLAPGSPCIDAGHNWGLMGLTDMDLDRNPRFADDPDSPDTGCGVPVIVDMGAYEFQGVPATVVYGDIDGDGVVNASDLLALLAAWSSSGRECELADLDLDGEVGTNDLLTLLGHWGG